MTQLRDQKYSILSAGDAPQYLDQLRTWFEAEWGRIDPFEGSHADFEIPSPILALDAQSILAGGLAFSSFAQSAEGEVSIWINALLVAPEHRRSGLASRLIQAALVDAAPIGLGKGLSKLFVRTDVPDLYEKLDWQAVERSDAGTILSKDFAPCVPRRQQDTR